MEIDEASRRIVHDWAARSGGPEVAGALMAMLPTGPASGLATRADVERQGADLRGEMQVLGGELRNEMQVLSAELRGEMQILSAELRGEMKAGNADLLRTLFLGMVGTNATLVGLVFAAVRLP